MKIVIIGGVAGGASAAARLRRLDENAEIIMLERGEYISYANCGLPYYIGGEITSKNALTLQTPKSFHDRFNIDVRVLNEVISIDRKNKTVLIRSLKTGEEYIEGYDKLILSPGAEPIRPGMPGMEDVRIFTLRTIPDTYRIHDYINENSPKTALIIGGGFIGLEMAENLSTLGIEVTLVEASDHVMASLDFDMACELHAYLKHKGVKLITGRRITGFNSEKGLSATLDDGSELAADMVLLSIGVRPESEIASKAGIKTNERGAVITDENMRTNDENIYAVGDAVEVRHFVSGKQVQIPLAGPANKQGRIAADNVCGIRSIFKGTQGSSILKLFDMTVAATGLNEKAAKAAGIEYDKVNILPYSHATYYPGAEAMNIKVLFEKKTGRILGAQLVGFKGIDKRCDVLATAIRAGMTAYDLTELELCYAPPFSSAKDPVNMAGFVIENVLTDKIEFFHWHDVEEIAKQENTVFLDTRTNSEYRRGAVEGAIHIPLDSLRENLSQLDSSKKIYVYCQSGLRSYIACRILSQNGFECFNLSGGYAFYSLVKNAVSRR